MWDCIIVGGGVAGLTAGMYAQRAGLKTLLFEEMFAGGQAATTYQIENYPGFVDPINGVDFAMKMEEHARKFGLEIIYDQVKDLQLDGRIKKVLTSKGEYESKTVILAMGAQARTLGLPKEDQFRGRGVSYCATCDGLFYKGKAVAVVGGGDTAVSDAIYLSKIAGKVYLIHRRDELRASKILQERVFENPNVELVWNCVADTILGEEKVQGLTVRNTINSDRRNLTVQGIFVAIGIRPNTKLVEGKIDTTEAGFILTDENMATGIRGVFAAGDIRQKSLRQIVTAASDGAIAAIMSQQYIIETD